MCWRKSEDLQNSLLLVSGVCVSSSCLHHLLCGTAWQDYSKQCQETNDFFSALQKLFLGKCHGCQPGHVSVGGELCWWPQQKGRISVTVGAVWAISISSLHFLLASLLAWGKAGGEFVQCGQWNEIIHSMFLAGCGTRHPCSQRCNSLNMLDKCVAVCFWIDDISFSFLVKYILNLG